MDDREQFEKENPVPRNVWWSNERNRYIGVSSNHDETLKYQNKWMIWKENPSMFNKELADRLGVDTRTQEIIEYLQNRLKLILNRPEMWFDKEEVPKVIESYEYVLQSLWGFRIDKKYHRYGYRVKGCTCPKLDNDDQVGYHEERWVTDNCPFHGGILDE